MEEEKQNQIARTQDQQDQQDQQNQNLQEEHLIFKIINATCTCNAFSAQDYRCQHLENCVFKTNKL